MAELQGASGEALAQGVVPILPLPNVYLFPGCVMPLHIFEPRYRQMIEDQLDKTGRIVMGALLEGQRDGEGRPAIHPIAGLGEIGRHERLPDGRFLVWLVGMARVRIEEVPSNRLYRTVRCENLEDFPATPEAEARLRPRVKTALLSRAHELLNLPDQVPLGHLADLLLQRLPLSAPQMRVLYSEVSVERRADGALQAHELLPRDAQGGAG